LIDFFRCVNSMILLNISSLKNTRFKIDYEDFVFINFNVCMDNKLFIFGFTSI